MLQLFDRQREIVIADIEDEGERNRRLESLGQLLLPGFTIAEIWARLEAARKSLGLFSNPTNRALAELKLYGDGTTDHVSTAQNMKDVDSQSTYIKVAESHFDPLPASPERLAIQNSIDEALGLGEFRQ